MVGIATEAAGVVIGVRRGYEYHPISREACTHRLKQPVWVWNMLDAFEANANFVLPQIERLHNVRLFEDREGIPPPSLRHDMRRDIDASHASGSSRR